jgi:hypothetical protein
MKKIEITFRNPKIIRWFDNFNNSNNDDRDKEIEKILDFGLMIKDIANIHINPDSDLFKPLLNQIDIPVRSIKNLLESQNISTIFNPIVNQFSTKIDQLETTINEFRGETQNSIKKGKIGENIVQTVIERYFPTDELINTSNNAHESDFHLKSYKYDPILIEIKTYSRNVPKKEIDKFKIDIETTQIKYAILASLTSGIVYKKTFSTEILPDGGLALYIPNCGIDGLGVIYGIYFMKTYMKYINESKDKNENDEIKNNYDELINTVRKSLIDLEKSIEKINIINKIAKKTKENVNKNMDELQKILFDLDIELKSIKEKIKI